MGGTEEFGEELHLRNGKVGGASSYAEGLLRCRGGGFGIIRCGTGSGYQRVGRGSRGVIRACGRAVGHCGE